MLLLWSEWEVEIKLYHLIVIGLVLALMAGCAVSTPAPSPEETPPPALTRIPHRAVELDPETGKIVWQLTLRGVTFGERDMRGLGFYKADRISAVAP